MTTTSAEAVRVDGVTLNTYARNIATFSGRSGVPDVRGDDIAVAYRDGRTWARKRWEPRTETWSMWVAGCDPDGHIPVTGSRAEFNQNLNALKALFGKRRSQLALEKDVRLPSGLVTLTGKGEVISAWDPETVAGGTRATMTVDMHMADPFWYGPSQSPAALTSAGGTITNPGSACATKMAIRFNGPLTSPVLTNTTIGVAVTVDLTILTGQYVDLDTNLFTALNQVPASVLGKVTGVGAYTWMELDPGANVFTLTRKGGGVVGAGTVAVTYLPPYL